CQHSYAIPWTF
nr:immunoglobulin light chain junction region [Macaca mulatta]